MIVTTAIRTHGSLSYPPASLEQHARVAFAASQEKVHLSATVWQSADRVKIAGHIASNEGLVLAALSARYSLAPGWDQICRRYAEGLSQSTREIVEILSH